MDSKQIDVATRKRLPVVYDGTKYDYIDEYVSKWKDGERHLSVGLRLGRSLYRVPADKVVLADGNGGSHDR